MSGFDSSEDEAPSVARPPVDSDAVVEDLRTLIMSVIDMREPVALKGMTCQLKMGAARSLYWRIYLGLLTLPPSDSPMTPIQKLKAMVAQAEAYRKTYAEQLEAVLAPQANAGGSQSWKDSKKKKSGKPRFGDDSTSSSEGEAVGDDPLAQHENSDWAKYFNQQKLLDIVDKDLGRLWPDHEFFDNDTMKREMRDCFAAWSEYGGNVVGYRQGMHEILSMLFLALTEDAKTTSAMRLPVGKTGGRGGGDSASEGEEELLEEELIYTLKNLCGHRHIRLDALAMFDAIIAENRFALMDFYTYGGAASPTSNGNDFGASALTRDGVVANNVAAATVDHVQKQLLKRHNEPLWKHLNTKLEIEPASYGVRWFRLLFLREFSFSQSALLWDAMLAEHFYTGCAAADGIIATIALCMLQYISAELITMDYAYAMRRLMRYPPVESVHGFVDSALHTKHKEGTPVHAMLSEFAMRTASDSVPHAIQSASDEETPLAPPPLVPPPPPLAAMSPGPAREKHIGEKLAAVIATLDSKWFPAEDRPVSEEEYLLAIAELKHLRDVLLGVADLA